MKNIIVSLIVAAYNVERYIGTCLESIKKQTYSGIEVIIVDDGSSDTTPFICDKYCELDNRFHCYHIKNQGLAHGRKFGFEHSIGDFICFVDGDDWLEEKYVEKLLAAINSDSGYDIAVCDFYTDTVSTNSTRLSSKITNNWDEKILCDKNMIFHEYLEYRLLNRMWNKIYRRSIVKQTVFPIGRDIMEDAFWTPQALSAAQSVKRISDCLYHYIIRNDSLIHRKNKRTEMIGSFLNMVDRLGFLLDNFHYIDSGVFAEEFNSNIRTIIRSGYKLDEHILKKMKNLTMQYIKLYDEQRGVAKLLLEANNSHQVHVRYFVLIWQSDGSWIFRFVESCKYIMCLLKRCIGGGTKF